MPVDLTSAVRFDLGRGTVKMGPGTPAALAVPGAPPARDTDQATLEERAVLLPEDVLADLVAAAGPEVSAVAGRQLGASIGKRFADRLGGANAVRTGSVEEVITALASELAVSGFGTVSLEPWGKAVVLVVENAPRVDGSFITSMLQGAIEAAVTSITTTASEQQVRCTLLAADEHTLRVLVASGRAVERVRRWLTEGVSWGDALLRLQTSAPRIA